MRDTVEWAGSVPAGPSQDGRGPRRETSWETAARTRQTAPEAGWQGRSQDAGPWVPANPPQRTCTDLAVVAPALREERRPGTLRAAVVALGVALVAAGGAAAGYGAAKALAPAAVVTTPAGSELRFDRVAAEAADDGTRTAIASAVDGRQGEPQDATVTYRGDDGHGNLVFGAAWDGQSWQVTVYQSGSGSSARAYQVSEAG